jgi:hypothetical protein
LRRDALPKSVPTPAAAATTNAHSQPSPSDPPPDGGGVCPTNPAGVPRVGDTLAVGVCRVGDGDAFALAVCDFFADGVFVTCGDFFGLGLVDGA